MCAWLEAKNFLLAPPRYRIDSAEALPPPTPALRDRTRSNADALRQWVHVASSLRRFVASSLRRIVALGSFAWAQELGVKLVLVGPINAGKTSLLLRSALRL